MRNAMGWTAAALLAAGCGGQGVIALETSTDEPGRVVEQQPPAADELCAACAFEGTGPVLVGTTEVAATVSAAPLGAAPPPPGGGTAASGTVAFALHDGSGAGACAGGTVDTIWSCEIEGGRVKVTFSGACHGGERFTAQIAGPGFSVRDFDRCEPRCPDGQCPCAETHQCEPCAGHDHGLPPPDGSTSPPDGSTSPPDGSTPPPPFVPL